MDKKTEIAAIILREAKHQYYSGQINIAEYDKILTVLYNNLTDLEDNQTRKNYIFQAINIPNCKIKLLDTLNLSLSLN